MSLLLQDPETREKSPEAFLLLVRRLSLGGFRYLLSNFFLYNRAEAVRGFADELAEIVLREISCFAGEILQRV